MIGMRRHSPRHLCQLPPRQHSDHSRGGSWQGN